MDQKLIILISDNSKNRKFRISLSWNFINSTKIPWNMTKKNFCRLRQCWAIGQLDVLDICPKPVQNLSKTKTFFSLDRFWTDYMTKNLILARIMTNFG